MKIMTAIMGLLLCTTVWLMVAYHASQDLQRPGAGRFGGFNYVCTDQEGNRYVYTDKYLQNLFEETLERLKDTSVKNDLQEFVPQFKLRRDDPKRFFFLELATDQWAFETAYGYREDGIIKVVLGIERISKVASEKTPELLEKQESGLVHEYSHIRDFLDGRCENIMKVNSWPLDKKSLTPTDRQVYLESRYEQLATETRAYLASCCYSLTHHPELITNKRRDSKFFDQLCEYYQQQDWEGFCSAIYEVYSEYSWNDARQMRQYTTEVLQTEERDYMFDRAESDLIPTLTHEP